MLPLLREGPLPLMCCVTVLLVYICEYRKFHSASAWRANTANSECRLSSECRTARAIMELDEVQCPDSPAACPGTPPGGSSSSSTTFLSPGGSAGAPGRVRGIGSDRTPTRNEPTASASPPIASPSTSTSHAPDHPDDRDGPSVGAAMDQVGPWPFLDEFFSYVPDSGIGGSSNIRFICQICKPAIKRISASVASKGNLSRHIKL